MGVGHGWRAAGVAAVLAATTACAAAPLEKPIELGPVAGGAGSLAQARKYLEGRWALESFEVRPPGRPAVALKGSGVLNYDDFGNLRMEIRADQASSDVLRAAGVEIVDGVIATNGRTVIDMQNRTLTYFLEGQAAADRTGGGALAPNRPRHWEVAGDVLTLTTQDDSGMPLSISRWKKSQ